MATKTARPGVSPDIGLGAAMPAAGAVTAPPEPPAAQESGLWEVTLNCPTPIQSRTLEVEAASEDEAWKKFMAANGICDSVHPRTIRRVA